MKTRKTLSKNNVQTLTSAPIVHWLFLILLIFSIGFRLSLLPSLYRLDDGDTARDYLIARHIVVHHEFPTIGPNNAIYESVRASPLYFYLLAIPVLVQDSVYSIGVFNILLQALSVVLLYTLAYTLFGQSTAILTAILLLFNQELFSQSFYMIQAHFGHVFFNGSYVFLAYSYIKKSYVSMCASAFLFALGCIVSFHGFPALLGYLIISFWILRAQKTPLKQIFTLFGVMALLGLFFYAPMLIKMVQTGHGLFLVREPVYITSFANFPLRVLANILLAMDDWVRSLWFSPILKNTILGLLGFILLHHTITNKQKTSLYVKIIALYVLQIAFLAAILRIETNSYQYDAATGLLLILLAFAASAAWPKNIYGRVGSWITAVCVIFLVIPTRGYIQWQITQSGQQTSLQNRMSPLYTYLDQQKRINPTSWNSDFQIVVYNGHANMYHWKESVIWNALEHKYAMPFIRVTNTGYGYAPITTREQKYIIICEEYISIDDATNRCIPSFTQSQQGVPYFIRLLSDNSPIGYILFSAELDEAK